MRLVCPGYRDPLDQNFRDESESVIKRAQKSYKASNRGMVTGVHRESDQDGVQWLFESSPLKKKRDADAYPSPESPTSLYLSPSVEQIALAYFMSSYVPGSHFDYLPYLYGQSGTGVLPATVHAASIATLARNIGEPEVMDRARRTYVQALLETNSSLADPVTATSDATLISVLLLSLFEAVVWTGLRTPESWTTHTRGALALTKLRGRQQFESSVGRQLFVQVANIICVDSIQRKIRLPEDLLELISIAMEYESDCPKYRLACLTGELSVLLVDINEHRLTAEDTVRDILCLEERYIDFTHSLVVPWTYEEVTVDVMRPEVYGRTVHHFSSHRAAQLWNSYRMTRILLNELIHKQAAHLPLPIATALQAQAVENIEQMAVDICASIPQFSDPADFGAPSHMRPVCDRFLYTQLPTAFPTQTSTAPLLWPLSAIQGASLASEAVRMYATERLNVLGRQFRVPQVERLTIEKTREMSALQDGLHMFYVS